MGLEMKKFLLACVFGIGLSPVALAADYEAPPPPEAYFDWTGFYAGLNAGAAINDSNVDGHAASGVLPGNIASELRDSFEADDTVFTGGVELGYNWQVSNFVVGVATDFNYLDFNKSEDRTRAITGLGTVDSELGFQADFFGTLRGRIGFAADNFLIYGTGGLAYAHEEIDGKVQVNNDTWRASESDVNWGWTLGGGAEWAMDDHWTIGAEYLYVDLGSTDFDFNSDALNAISEKIDGKTDAQFSVIRATMKYMF